MSHPHADSYGITESNLALRRRFIRLGEADREIMLKLIPWAAENAPKIVKAFYDWQFAFEPTKRFFERMAAERGMSMDALRQHLESAQVGYYNGLFTGARSNWGLDYFEHRLKVGKVHDRINLPQKWYIGSYIELQRLTRTHLRKSFRRRRFVDQAEDSIFKVFNFDSQAVVDSFMLSTIQSLRLSIDMIGNNADGGDKTEHLGDLKSYIGQLTGQLLENVDAMGAIAAASEQLAQSVEEISRNTSEAANVAMGALDSVEAAAQVIQQLGQAGAEIGDVLKVINSIAAKTNLLALNATVEAARAGEAGRSFAVVANDVKELSRSTASATDDVSQKVNAIRLNVAAASEAMQQINATIASVNEFATAIAGAVEEQSVTVRDITSRVSFTASETEQLTRYVAH
ncbi:MAG: globin-coupled sensor protein [Gammaproteobacteria bacterium]|nr:globin-coupled sensor protein [Gammaproteobacteria bacterium]